MWTLVLGVGNSLRGDDGVGAKVLELLEAAQTTTHQRGLDLHPTLALVPELAADIVHYRSVIFVDADVKATNVTLERVGDAERDGFHRSSPASLVSYARELGFKGDAWVCRVPVESMQAGAELSPRALMAAREAANLLLGVGTER